jgi:hypothetical protein
MVLFVVVVVVVVVAVVVMISDGDVIMSARRFGGVRGALGKVCVACDRRVDGGIVASGVLWGVACVAQVRHAKLRAQEILGPCKMRHDPR